MNLADGCCGSIQYSRDQIARIRRQEGQYAEGWRRHSHLGFSAVETDPLMEILAEFCSAREQ
jgi:hypothetical protein